MPGRPLRFAGIASLPGRPLEQAVRSLLPQVDCLGIWLNAADDIPDWLQSLLRSEPVRLNVEVSRDNLGSSMKLYWYHQVRFADPAYYFACDDDLEYPLDYADRMVAELERWDGRAIVTACGRTLARFATRWTHWVGPNRYIDAVPEARWINYVGGCAMAFRTDLELPVVTPMNEEEAVISVWAQQRGIPIRLIQRPYDWPKRIPLPPGAFTLYEEAAKEQFATRSAIISRHAPWVVHVPQ